MRSRTGANKECSQADGRQRICFDSPVADSARTLGEPIRLVGPRSREKYVLITGGAGFIGANLANRLLSNGESVLIYDDLSRAGSERNLAWLRDTYPDGLRAEIADVRDERALSQAVHGAAQVFHLAAQTAVTGSLIDPRHDFEVNAGGTLTLLECLRTTDHPPPLVFTSTNKVYGSLAQLPLEESPHRYSARRPSSHYGIDETHRLDFQSPYGCSKGTADQYVLDYARTFGIPAIVFRMSCIYGPHQNGTEDQGWVAHFLRAGLERRRLTIYGNGKQVRDLLFVEDLANALLLAQANIEALAGHAFNIGGGPENTVSLLELLSMLPDLQGTMPEVAFKDWRPLDQRYYVSDIRKFQQQTGWAPSVSVQRGLREVCRWLLESGRIGPARQRSAEASNAFLAS